jgi:hypothetical protein
LAHSNTERLMAYWRQRRSDRRLPRRSDIDPTGFARLASSAFLAGFERDGDLRFRLAGEEVIELHGRPLAGRSLSSLWTAGHRGRVLKLAHLALRAAQPLVILAAAAGSDGAEARLEVLIAPLTGPDGSADRFLGLYQLTSCGRPAPLGPLIIVGADVTAISGRAPLRLAAVDGLRIA